MEALAPAILAIVQARAMFKMADRSTFRGIDTTKLFFWP